MAVLWAVICMVIIVPALNALEYLSHEELTDFLQETHRQYPNITHIYSIGKTTNHRDLLVIAIGRNASHHSLLNPEVKYVGNMHGNEVVSRVVLTELIRYYTSNYNANDTITRFLNTTRVHILVSLNPDGFAYAVGNKTEGKCDGVLGRGNAANVDINRDFPDFFADNNKHRQPETRIIMDWLTQYPFILSANLHGGAMVVNYPYDNYPNARGVAVERPSQDDDIFKHISRVYSYSHHDMNKGNNCPNDFFPEGITNGAHWYPVTGGMQDYNYIYGGCMEITLELSCCKFPRAADLQSYWDKNKDALVNFLLEVHRGVKGVVTDSYTKHPVMGALVTVVGRQHPIIKTTQAGEYWRILLPGTYTLKITSPNYADKSVEVIVPNNVPQLSLVDISLTPGEPNPSSAMDIRTTITFTVIICSIFLILLHITF